MKSGRLKMLPEAAGRGQLAFSRPQSQFFFSQNGPTSRPIITHTDAHCLTDLLPCKRTYQSLRQRGHDYSHRALHALFYKLSSF